LNKVKIFLLLIFNYAPQEIFSQNILWQKCLGGSGTDIAQKVQQTFDLGFIIAATTNSVDGDIDSSFGNADAWIIKIDSNGNVEWKRNFGGSYNDAAIDIIQTADSGYLFCGATSSEDGDVTGHHGTAGLNSEYQDIWVVRLNSIGDLIWQKCLGGTDRENGNNIIQMHDGGYVVSGFTYSTDGDVDSCSSNNYYWTFKLDYQGNLEWQHCYDGIPNGPYDLCNTRDGGFALIGKGIGYGIYDFWAAKADSSGNIMWTKNYGGSCLEEGFSIQQCADEGFIMAGYTYSNDHDVISNHNNLCMNGSPDYWIIKTDSFGNLLKQKCLGGTFGELACSIKQTVTDDYIVVGVATSTDGDVTGNHGYDYWIVHLDSSLNVISQYCIGGGAEDDPYSIIQTTDSGFVVIGSTRSTDGDVIGNHGFYDVWVVKISSLSNEIVELNSITDFSISFNPASHILQFYFYYNQKETIKAELLDIEGRSILHQKIVVLPGYNEGKILGGHLASGIYLLRLMTKDTSITKKILIE